MLILINNKRVFKEDRILEPAGNIKDRRKDHGGIAEQEQHGPMGKARPSVKMRSEWMVQEQHEEVAKGNRKFESYLGEGNVSKKMDGALANILPSAVWGGNIA